MPRDEENYVALFIDWDNLAISTAVDFAGAIPDVRAIVRAAQRSGTVLVARAYAEWNVSSDRLSVYRAGVEPVYAPTFRFEPDPGSSVPRGKSLADPCLVTDCIDLLHLMPEINVFVLVSGDKDLIPIVRLAQLRGRRVVVIGPDFVAAILREMADEYIPYRTLVEIGEPNGVAEVTSANGRGQRRGGSVRTSAAPPLSAGRSAVTPRPLPAQAAPPVPARQPIAETNGTPAAEVASPAASAEAVGETVPTEETLDVAPLWAMISTIVRDREASGKPQLRATNLKDQLLARIPGFNERKYGFARFKDLLTAAEEAGVIVVNRSGPVQWVAAPSRPAPVPAAVAPPVAESATETPAPVVPAPVAEAATVPAASTDEEIDPSIVRFIVELRDRSRWLTYTYLLTNLLNHLGKGSSDAAADAAARTTLNRLVQAGVLVVDREPREIDVNGTHHRVRLCHVVDEHPLVARIMVELAADAVSAISPVSAPPEAPIATAPLVAEETSPTEPTALAEAPPSELASATVEPSVPAAEPASSASAPSAAPSEPAPAPVAEVPVETASSTLEAPADSVAQAAPPVEPTEVSAEESATTAGESVSENGHDGVATTPLSLNESYAVLRDVVREATGPNRPSTGPAAVKNRLVRRLGAFDERSYGFSKFKDYLLAAERAGAVRVEVAGNTSRVSLPPE
jgi:hypothetical protein